VCYYGQIIYCSTNQEFNLFCAKILNINIISRILASITEANFFYAFTVVTCSFSRSKISKIVHQTNRRTEKTWHLIFFLRVLSPQNEHLRKPKQNNYFTNQMLNRISKMISKDKNLKIIELKYNLPIYPYFLHIELFHTEV
jgi:hypothetical protein